MIKPKPRIKKIKQKANKLSKTVIKYRTLIALNVFFVVLVSFVVWQVSVNERNSSVELPIPPMVQALTADASSTPERLIIPEIGVDAYVQLVGVTKKGNMGVPDKFMDVGWYRLGFFPGSVGNAVIAGHLDNGPKVPAVFKDLSKLRVNDMVYVVNKEGKKLGFKVVGYSMYDYDNAPLDNIFGSSTESHLNLITCDGVWDPANRIYNKRLIVYTTFTGVIDKEIGGGGEVSAQ